MHVALSSGSSASLVVDYVSPEGPTVTHARGSLLVAALQHLKTTGVYERYLGQLRGAYRERILYTLASSWVPLELIMVHLDACDALELPSELIQQQGEQVGKEVGAINYKSLLRVTKSLGVDPGWVVLKQCDRFHQRVYQGGRCTLTRTGPKDALLELHGLPMARSPYFRHSHHAYLRGLSLFMSNASYVKPARPRTPSPECMASAFSWV